jgi:endonuclease YncB( thermonuclease family)
MNLLKYACCCKKFFFGEESTIIDNKKNDKNINDKNKNKDDKKDRNLNEEEEVINLDEDDINKLLDKQPKHKDYLKKDDKIYLKSIKDKLYENDKCEYFSFVGKTFFARPINIYDGDTFSIIFLHKDVIKYRCRCIDYDSPEMKPSLSNPNREKEKALAVIAKNRFTELLTKHESGLVFVECFEFDKYGRILVRVYNMIDTKSINEIMIEEGHGKIYDGGKKDTNW